MTDAEGLVEAVARGIVQADEQDGGAPWDRDAGNKHVMANRMDRARAALSAISAAGYVLMPRGDVEILLDVHTERNAPDLAIKDGARLEFWQDRRRYIAAWERLRLAAAPKVPS